MRLKDSNPLTRTTRHPARRFRRLAGTDEGVTSVEYALIAAMATFALFTAAGALGRALAGIFHRLAEEPFW